MAPRKKKAPETLAELAKRLKAKPGSRAISGQAACQEGGCKRGLWWYGEGKRPRKCDAHVKNKRRGKTGRRLVPVPELASKRQEKRAWTKTAEQRIAAATCPDSGESEFDVARMAVGLRRSPGNVQAAARRVGITGTIEDLEQLAQKAQGKEYADLREGRTTSVADRVTEAMQLAAINLTENVHAIPPSQQPLALSMMHKVLEGLGGGKLNWSQVTVVLGRKKGT